MTIEITIKFNTYEEAAIALAKLGGFAPKPKESAAPASDVNTATKPSGETTEGVILQASPVAADPIKPRRGRPRRTAQAAAPSQGEPPAPSPAPQALTTPISGSTGVIGTRTGTVNPPTPPAAAPAPQVLPPVAAVSLEDAQKAMEVLFTAQPNGGAEKAIALLARFGTKRVRELKVEQYAAFKADAELVVDGKYDPVSGKREEGV